MSISLLLAAAAVVSALPLAWWAVSGADRSAMGARNLRAGRGVITDMRQAVLAYGASERAVRPMVRRLANRSRRLTPQGVIEALERRILLAGAPPAWPLERALAGKVVLGAAGLVLGGLRFLGAPSFKGLLMWALFSGVGYVGPDLILRSKATKRQAQIQTDLPDTLDQITISVEAGLGFDAAMARSAKTGKGPLAEELLRTLQDFRAGMSRAQAFHRLVSRTEVPELHHFILALVQADNFGVPIAGVLRVQSGEMRVKRRQRAEEKAMKIPVKVLFPLMVCILPCMFIVIIGPAGLSIARNFSEF